MNVNLELIEKLLVGLVPGGTDMNVIHSNFNVLRNDPNGFCTAMWNELYPILKNPEDPAHAGAINGVILGVSLYYGGQRSEQLIKNFREYMVDRARMRGEHVIDFYEARAGRRPC